MFNCKKCGASIKDESKFCSYCGCEVNKEGKEYEKKAFLVKNIFSIGSRFMIIGTAMQTISISDKLSKNNLSYDVVGIQVGRTISNVANQGADCALLLKNLNKNDVKIGDEFYFERK